MLNKDIFRKYILKDETPALQNEAETEVAREERKATGRSIAIIIFLSGMICAM